MTSKGHAKVLILKVSKQTDMTTNGHAMALILKKLSKQADMTSKGHAKALVLKQTEETSRHDLERAGKGARPQAN